MPASLLRGRPELKVCEFMLTFKEDSPTTQRRVLSPNVTGNNDYFDQPPPSHSQQCGMCGRVNPKKMYAFHCVIEEPSESWHPSRADPVNKNLLLGAGLTGERSGPPPLPSGWGPIAERTRTDAPPISDVTYIKADACFPTGVGPWPRPPRLLEPGD